jgi:hypothetical protein
MRHGDLVRVFYYDGGMIGIEKWDGPFHGFITMTPDDHENAIWQMWCIERNTQHVLSPHKDRIEVVSEA